MLPILFLAIFNYYFNINLLICLMGLGIYSFIGGVRYGKKIGMQEYMTCYYDEVGNIRECSFFRKINNSLKEFVSTIIFSFFSLENIISVFLFFILSLSYTKVFSVEAIYILMMFYMVSELHTLGTVFCWIFIKK